MTCSVEDCDDPVKAKGLCHRHRMHAWRYGDPLAAPHGLRQRGTLEERFWQNVTKGDHDECWEWQGTDGGKGYGVISGRLAHRVSFEMANGYLPPVVLHACDNPPCVNPSHLRGGTQVDNMLDCRQKVRHGRPLPKVRDADIPIIMRDPRSNSEVAKDYGVSKSLIYKIRTGRRRTSILTTKGMAA